MGTKKTTPATTTRKAELPEDLEQMLKGDLTEEQAEALWTQRREKRIKSLDAQKERFIKNLQDKKSANKEIWTRKILVKRLQEERTAAQFTIKVLRAEMRAIRQKAKDDKKAKVVKAAS